MIYQDRDMRNDNNPNKQNTGAARRGVSHRRLLLRLPVEQLLHGRWAGGPIVEEIVGEDL